MRTSAPLSFSFAVAMMLTAILFYDVMGAIIKYLSETYPTAELALFRNIFGLVPAVALLLCSRNWKEAGRPLVIRQWRFGLVRGFVGAGAQISFYLAVFHIEFATATAMVFVTPLFVTALSIPILNQKVGVWRWLAVMLGFAGVMWVMQPTGGDFTFYGVLPLVAALGYATTSVTAKLFDDDVPTPLLNLYYNAGCMIGALALMLFTQGFVRVGELEHWIWLIVMGICGGCAALLRVSAYRFADASSLSPFEYFAIPFSFGLGWVFFAEAPFERLFPGVFLIIGGGLLVAWRERLIRRRALGATVA